MAAWSGILRVAGQKLLRDGGCVAILRGNGQTRCMSEKRLMVIRPSNFQWHKTKDWIHFYFLLGFIPVGIGLFIINVFIGPATLQEIPEGYIPKEWEYHQHPIKRFMQRYLFPSPQQEYEKFLHHIYNEQQVRKVRMLESQINKFMGTHRDFRGPYFREGYGSKYLYLYRKTKDEMENLEE